ncbi:MAG: transcription-repair coupling factor [Deltaproteobacteria bacterium]|nr:transcription-repair coupling factor [Deltaproteobacteria bacterium]
MNTEDQFKQKIIRWIEEDAKKVRLSGLSGSARSYFIARVVLEIERPCLLVLPRAEELDRFYRELKFFLPEGYYDSDPEIGRLYDFPVYDISPLAGLSPHRNIINRRIQALYALTSQKCPIVVTSLEAILFRVMPKEAMVGALEYLVRGEDIDREDLLKKLEKTGYTRTSLVEEPGDYSVRGGVVDIFPPLYDQPIRLELFGDQLESLRHFDPVSQRSVDYLKEVILLPASEIIISDERLKRARSMGRLPEQGSEGAVFPGQEAWLNHYYKKLDTLKDYLPQNSIVFIINLYQFDEERVRIREKFYGDIERFRLEAGTRGMPFPETDGLMISEDELKSLINDYQFIDFSELAIAQAGEYSRSIEIKEVSGVDFDTEIRISGKGRISMAPLAEKIAYWLGYGFRVVLVCRTIQQAERLKEILQNYDVDVNEIAEQWSVLSSVERVSICLGRLRRGFVWPENGIAVISEDEIFGPKRSRSRTAGKKGETALDWTSFSQLQIGDLVVHKDHGIGRYGGLLKMEVEKKVNDYVILEYAGGDRLYTPADRISVLQKYIGADEKDPKLDRLGGKSWNVAKKKAKKSVMEIARQLVEIYALRKYRKGFAFSRPDNYFREFEATFEHEETQDQIKAIEDVLSDMENEQPMDRLICGDVGFGKTEIAVRSSFKAVMDGKQVALLVPTTVLAEQHYGTFRSRMEPFGVKTAVLSRFKSRAEQKDIIARVRSGKIDILIGTHRLLQKDISFRDLGLLVIDEEQRFGVKQKEEIKKYRTMVDVLAMSATPIPRTLHLSLMGVRDLSIIETPPEERLAISTYLLNYDESTIQRAIRNEIKRNGQIFFVHNRVNSINRVAEKLVRLVPEANFAVAHGQMNERELEETMMRFIRREIDVLICTTIIESGLDIPSANTIIINEVDHLGLSQIYQLRGRVGRSAENAYAYLLLGNASKMTRQAERRLKALMDYSHLGAGVHLALHDLKIRGGGNVLGFSQSGHITSIGYELYMNMIEQAIAELKGEEWKEEINPEINADIPAYLPEDYIQDIDVRLNLYRRLSVLREKSELKNIVDEMIDRFGPQPIAVSNLIKIMDIRLILKKIGVIRLDVNGKHLLFSFSPSTDIRPDKLLELMSRKRDQFRFLSDSRLKVSMLSRSDEDALSRALDFIRIMEKSLLEKSS